MMQSGTNSLRGRDYNQQLVLEIVRLESEVSRVEIAERTGLTAQTISNIVRRLVDEGLVVEAGRGPSDGSGKPRMRLRINPEAGYAAGVQIERDEVSFVLLDMDGRVVTRTHHAMPVGQSPYEVVELVGRSLERGVEEMGLESHKILGVGVACPGPLDPSGGVVYAPPGLDDWREVWLKEMLEKRTGYAVTIENDAIACAVGERWTGKARGASNFAFVYKGWGLGAGLFVEGHVYRGNTGTAGEIGHVPLDPNGPECTCGNRGCLVRYCSPREIVSSITGKLEQGWESTLKPEGLDFETICKAALEGDELALEELEQSGRMLSRALVGLVNLLDIELVVLGGKAFRDVGHLYEKEVYEDLKKKILYPERRKVRVELSGAEDPAAVGAAALILYTTYAPRFAGLKAP